LAVKDNIYWKIIFIVLAGFDLKKVRSLSFLCATTHAPTHLGKNKKRKKRSELHATRYYFS